MRSSHLKLFAPQLFPHHHAYHPLKPAHLASPPLTPLPQFEFVHELTQPVAWLAQEFDPLKSALSLQDLLCQRVIGFATLGSLISFTATMSVAFRYFAEAQYLSARFSFQAVIERLG